LHLLGILFPQITFGLLQTQRLINGGKWKVVATTMKVYLFDPTNMLTRQV